MRPGPAPLVFFLCSLTAFAGPYDDGRVKYQEKHYEEAERLLREATSAEPANAAAWHWLGKAARKQGRAGEAAAFQQKAIGLEPGNAEYWIGLGDAYGDMAKEAPLFDKLGLAKKCHAALAQSIKLDPTSMAARSAMIDFCRQAPEIAGGGKARAHAEAEAYKEYNLEGGTLLQGALLVREKRFAEAVRVAHEATLKLPDSYALHFAAGRAAALGGVAVESGITHLRRCLELTPAAESPGHGAVWFRLGDLYSRSGDTVAAREAYTKAVALDPSLEEAAEKLKALPQS